MKKELKGLSDLARRETENLKKRSYEMVDNMKIKKHDNKDEDDY